MTKHKKTPEANNASGVEDDILTDYSFLSVSFHLNQWTALGEL